MLKVLTSSRASVTAADDDELPVITVVNAANWTDADSIELFSLKSEDLVSKAATSALNSQVAPPRGARKQKNVQIPNSSSAVSAPLETHREKKTVKPRTISQSSKAVMMWVSSHDSQLSVKSPRPAVKNVIFLSSAEISKSTENKDKVRRRVPLKLTSLKHQLTQEGKGCVKSKVEADPGWSRLGPHADLQVKKIPASPQCHQLVPVDQTPAAALEAKDEQQPPRSARSLRPRNKPVLLQPACERMQRRHTRDQHHTSKHKLDVKTDMDRIDWENLQRQTYLWRRRALPADSQCSAIENKADHVPDSLHPAPIPSSHLQSKNLLTTGAAICQNEDYMNGIWQCCSRFLTSKYKSRPLRNDDFKFWFSTYWNPAQHAVNADDQSDAELWVKEGDPPPNSKQSSLVSNTEGRTRSV
ncbi:uncharacterized protein LOC127375919 [Scomber scombrus]|uniref:Uncharacterized protein LOC127375919 n=1 Tax=Scomber scombrus TaxID=13677 RepID=A0AAV1NKJ1_SCOSC